MRNIWKKAIALMIGITALALWPASNLLASSITLSASPIKATANSVYTFRAVWKDTDGVWPTPIRTLCPAGHNGMIRLRWESVYGDSFDTHSPAGLIGGIPMYYEKGEPKTGAVYTVSVSGGLNLSNPNQNPNTYSAIPNGDGTYTYNFIYLPNVDTTANPNCIWDTQAWIPAYANNLLWDPRFCPIWYAPNFCAWDNGVPRNILVKAYAWGNDVLPTTAPIEDSKTITVHDSRANWQLAANGSYAREMINYGGQKEDRDKLSAGPPDAPEIDPLTVEPSSDPSISGDDGSASNEYVFRVKYSHLDGRPPIAWWQTPNYGQYDYFHDPDWGVALYLDVLGIGDYRLIPMRPEVGGSTQDPYTALTWSNPGQVFIARLLPNDGLANPLLFEYNGLYFPGMTCWAYNSLPVGAFKYFFACSDDWLQFALDEGIVDDKGEPAFDSERDFPRQAPFLLQYQPNLSEWGLEPAKSQTWTIPTGYNDVDRLSRLTAVRDTIDWSKIPFDATDKLWSSIPWGLNGAASNAPDYTTIPFYANNNPLDPNNQRQVTGIRGTTATFGIDRGAGRSYSTDNRYPFDSTIFVDRPVFVPGEFYPASTYQYSASVHPTVSGALTVPVFDDVAVSMRDTTKYGGGRYYGTLLFGTDRTFKRAMNPQLSGTYLPSTSVRDFDSRRAETAGATTSTLCTFRIMYKSKEGRSPSYMRVMIGNTSSRGNNRTDNSDIYTDWDHDGHPGCTMWLEDPANLDYKNGVWFIYQTNISTPGPHHYFFEANDQVHSIVWPRRPDHYDYSEQIWEDWWVPTLSTPDDVLIDDGTGTMIDNPDYDNNDFVPGPYINSKPQLSDWTVTPTSGKQGQTFTFRVLYKDADGQKPYSTNLVLETNTSGETRTCQMLPEITLDSNQNNSAKYKAGVYYYFNTASVQDMILQNGTRRFKFQFTDDWGRQVGVNDRVSGETYETSWVSGPTVKANSSPTLYDGSVVSSDGTSNEASLWTFSATYADQDNESPNVKKVFIGLLQPDGKTVLWDEGHDMIQSDVTDTTYNDGVLFYYQTRLSGKQNEFDSEKQYYYAFLFKDGNQWATYKSSSDDEKRSNAASCITSNMTEGLLHGLGGNQYQFRPVIVQQASVKAPVGGLLKEVAPSDPDDILELYGVYTSEDLETSTIDNKNYYVAGSSPYATGEPTVYLNEGLPSNTTRVWLKYQGQSPIVGPLPGTSSITATNISDAKVYDGTTEKLVDDLKNGWQATGDARYSIMQGVALDSQSNPSVKYVVPENASIIASVEGVYPTLASVNNPAQNHYDPATVAYHTMTGTVDPTAVYDSSSRTGITVLPASPDLIRSVDKVYSDPAMTIGSEILHWGINSKGTILLKTDMALGSTVYIRYARTMYNAGDSIIWLTSDLPTAGQRVFIKYSDYRFTHTINGAAQQSASGTWTQGTTHFSPDGWRSSDVHIKGNALDPTGGVLGIWTDSSTSRSYFDPFRTTYADNPLHLALTYEVPSGTNALWARYYQNGDYTIDRWNRIVQFKSAPGAPTNITSTYMFGKKMPMTVGANNPPVLSDGSVTPRTSESSAQYVYKVKYSDTDGPNGQAPAYVKVYIDGNAQLMTQASAGTPAYREGAYYTYTTSNLAAKGHKYRFEASDGADIVLYDYYTDKNEERPDSDDGSTFVFKDIDGPYVNSQPKLLNGSATPTGTVSVNAPVTFGVTYQDPDSDPPYFFDATKDIDGSGNPIGTDVSGSPRLWIDTNDTDTLNLGKVDSISLDPLTTNKYRTIVATDTNGNNPNWTVNQFAGKLMQMTSGDLLYRVYLIQSNTANTLTLATDDLGPSTTGDKMDVANHPTFTINGLLMIRQDTTDYSIGSRYQLTVPKLAVGSHSYKFSARSRITKPQWLLDIETTFQPYSGKVVFPASGSSVGPTVESTAPTGNVAPVLSNTAETSIFKGPKVDLVTVVSTGSVEMDTSGLGNWVTGNAENVRQVVGVYLTDPAVGSPDNYYDTTQTFDPITSKSIKINALGSMPAKWQQTGTIDSSLREVIPSSVGSIATVTGVYLNADLSGPNYLVRLSDTDPQPTFNTSSITLPRDLPAGTGTVYIECAPVMYLKYYEKHDSTTKFITGEPVTFAVNYSDADNDPPTYHDGVQGYLKLVFTNSGKTSQLLPVATAGNTYTSPVAFQVTMTDFPEGTVRYHFEGSDGYDPGHKVIWPATDYSLLVNYKPTLTGTSMLPSYGPPGTEFKFNVTYKDLDGSGAGARTPTVKVRLTNTTDSTEYIVDMTPTSDSPIYATGAVFAGSKAGLPSGTYSVAFEANDGYQDAVPVAYSNLVVRDTNFVPEIKSYTVSPAAGKQSSLFVYTAIYSDGDNDRPVVIRDNTSVEGLTLLIDKGLSTEQTVIMTRFSTAPGIPDYTAGVTYKASVLGSKLGTGVHTYTVKASDGTSDAVTPAVKSGPIMLTPYITNLRAVSASSLSPDSATGLTMASVGDNVLIVGKVKLPVNTVTGTPLDTDFAGIAIKVTKPDGTQLALQGKVTMLEETDGTNWIGNLAVALYPSGADAALVTGQNVTLCASGEWKVSAVWSGNSNWDRVETDENSDGISDNASILVGGPTRTVAIKDASKPDDIIAREPVVDMITPPMKIGSGNPGALFGYSRASLMQIVRWIPESKDYYWYGVSGSFPTLQPGQAIWIKPKSEYPSDSISTSDATTGMLALGNPDGLDYSKKYRLIKVFSKAYDTQINSKTGITEYTPCTIQLNTGWNQFGNIFFNWKRDDAGEIISPREDVGIPISEVKVKYLDQEKTLDQAAAAGWIRNYAWRWDASEFEYVPVHATLSGAERVLKAWSGYWIKAFVDCKLIINPNTSYNGVASGATASSSATSAAVEKAIGIAMNTDYLDIPPMPE